MAHKKTVDLNQISQLIKLNDATKCEQILSELCAQLCNSDSVPGSRGTGRLNVDTHALALLPEDIEDIYVPLKTTGNGSCLYNACSLCLTGNESLAESIRGITALELFLNQDKYCNHPYFQQVVARQGDGELCPDDVFLICLPDELSNDLDIKTGKKDAIWNLAIMTAKKHEWSGMLQVLAVANSLKLEIRSVCPDVITTMKAMLDVTIVPFDGQTTDRVAVMWTRETLDNRSNVVFQPDHIVALEQRSKKRPGQDKSMSVDGHNKRQKKKQSSIDTFFELSTHVQEGATFSPEPNQDDPSCPTETVMEAEIPSAQERDVLSPMPSTSSDQNDPTSKTLDIVDFDHFASDDIKVKLIQNRKPDKGFKFPSREYKDSKRKGGLKKRYCNPDWFETFRLIAYSKKEDGLFCLACKLFPTESTTGMKAKFLISKPYKNWKDAVAELKSHMTIPHHVTSELLLNSFMETYHNPQRRVDFCLTVATQNRIARNREIMKSIIKCIEFCGRQGIALQGHDDDDTNVDPHANFGNFKTLIQFRIDSSDEILKSHLNSAPNNATYLSKTAQNDILQCIKENLTEQIIEDVKAQPVGPLYGVQVDEVTDCSNWEQEGIVIRYGKNLKPVERLVGYVKVSETTGESLYDCLINALEEIGLEKQNCRSQTYDGARNMSGEHRGVNSRFLQENPQAHYLHCSNHGLNLALSTSSKLAEIHCMIENLKKLGYFLYWPKRQRCFEESVDEINENRAPNEKLRKIKIKPMCNTRWVERHSSLEEFADMYEAIVFTLQKIARNRDVWDSNSMTEASGLLNTITSPTFIVAFNVNLYVFGFTKALSILLQGSTQNILDAYEEVDLVKHTLVSVRNDADSTFRQVYQEAIQMGKKGGTNELDPPRRCGSQTLRNNMPSDNSEEYWKRSIFIPFMDEICSQFEVRFSKLARQAIKGLYLLPIHLNKLTDQHIEDIVSAYRDGMPSMHTFQQEILLWKRYWCSIENKPGNLEKTLAETNQGLYPNLFYVLYVLLITSATSSAVERAHSALKRIKTPIRSSMTQPRLAALLLLHIHKDMAIDYDKVVNVYAAKHHRRMLLSNPYGDAE